MSIKRGVLIGAIVASSLCWEALVATALPNRVTRESAYCESINLETGEYVRDDNCFVDLHHTPIIATAVDIYWSSGVVTRASMNVDQIDFVGFLEAPANIDGVPGRYITTGLENTNCFEMSSNRNKFCFSIKD